MYQEYKDSIFVVGIILTFIVTFYFSFKTQDFAAMLFSMLVSFIIFLVAPIVILGVVSDKIEKRNSFQTYSQPISETEQVFRNISEKSNFANLEPIRASLFIPDNWYDNRGMIKNNIKIDIFSEKHMVLSFIDVKKKECLSLIRMAHMYGGIIEDEQCRPINSVNINFYARNYK